MGEVTAEADLQTRPHTNVGLAAHSSADLVSYHHDNAYCYPDRCWVRVPREEREKDERTGYQRPESEGPAVV